MNISSNEKKYSSKLRSIFIYFYFKKLYSILNNIEFKKAADIGCGEGRVLAKVKNKYSHVKWYGLDISSQAISLAQTRNKDIDFKLGSIFDIPFQENDFDLVLCLEVLEHLKEYQKAIGELIRISKRYVLISVPREPWFSIGSLLVGKYLKQLGRHPEHVNFWSKSDIYKELNNHFLIVEIKATIFWTLVLVEKK